MLGYLFSAWLLNKKQIRLLPSLSSPNSLRIEPSAYVQEKEIEKLYHALKELCLILKEKRTCDLLKFLCYNDFFSDNKNNKNSKIENFFPTEIEQAKEQTYKVAFIGHYAFTTKEIRMMEKDLCRASDTAIRIITGNTLCGSFVLVLKDESLPVVAATEEIAFGHWLIQELPPFIQWKVSEN